MNHIILAVFSSLLGATLGSTPARWTAHNPIMWVGMPHAVLRLLKHSPAGTLWWAIKEGMHSIVSVDGTVIKSW